MNRLTARRDDNGLAYLKNVKLNEQEVDSHYPNTLKCILESFKRLAAYEDTGLEPNEIKALAERESAAVADLESCRLDHVRTCANYQKCFDKAKEEFRMTPCMSKNCPGWEWRGPQPPKEEN